MNKLHYHQPRFYLPDEIYYIVTKTYNNFPYFKERLFRDLLIEELRLCRDLKEFRLYGFCLIYDHLNLLIQPGGKYNISQIMQSLKKEYSRDANYIIGEKATRPVGDIPECRLRGEQYSRRYDRKFKTPNLAKYHREFLDKYGSSQNIFPAFRWEKSFYDHAIRDENDLANCYNYCVYNYLKHDLPANWLYTSINYPDLINGTDWQ